MDNKDLDLDRETLRTFVRRHLEECDGVNCPLELSQLCSLLVHLDVAKIEIREREGCTCE